MRSASGAQVGGGNRGSLGGRGTFSAAGGEYHHQQQQQHSDLIGAFRAEQRASRDSSSSASQISQVPYRGQELPENAQFRKQVGYRL